MSRHLAFYSVVRILPSSRTTAAGIDGRSGVVLGVSESAEHAEYAVLIGEESYMVDGSDLAPTGEVLSRDAIYDGTSVRVRPQRYPKDD